MAVVVLQRGHVPRTTGRTGAPGEQRFAIETADRAAEQVLRLGHEPRIIDADPMRDSLYRGDFFIALHYDSSGTPSVHGASVGYQSAAGRDLASRWKTHYAANGWQGGFRSDNYTTNLAGYYGVREALAQGNVAAMIVEAGFHSSPSDAAQLASPDGPRRVAIAIAGALVDQLGCRCPEDGVVPPASPYRARVAQLQQLIGVAPDGIIGPRTQAAMWSHRIAWGRYAPGNDERGLVSWLQRQGSRLGYPCTVDGIVGPQTNHLIVVVLGQADGICGPIGFQRACT